MKRQRMPLSRNLSCAATINDSAGRSAVIHKRRNVLRPGKRFALRFLALARARERARARCARSRARAQSW